MFSDARSFTVALAVLAGLAGCSKPPAKVVVTPPKASLVGRAASVTLKAEVQDTKGAALPEIPVAWSSSDEAVASVDASGKVTPKGSGEARVVARAGKLEGGSQISVIMVTEIRLSLPQADLAGPEGTIVPLTVKVLDDRGRELPGVPLALSSSNPARATVDPMGKVTLLSSGPVTLKASAGKVDAELSAEVLIQIPKFLKLTKTAMGLKQGESALLEFEVFDEKGKPCKIPPAFSSDNEKVATVDASGKVTATGPGSADITLAVGLEKRPVKVTVR